MTVLTPWKVICQVNLLDFFLEDVQLVEKEDDGRVFEPGHAYDFLQEPLGLLHPVGGLVLKEDLQSVVVGERNILTDVSSKILRDLALSVISNRKKPAKIAQTVGELFKRCNLFFFPFLSCAASHNCPLFMQMANRHKAGGKPSSRLLSTVSY